MNKGHLIKDYPLKYGLVIKILSVVSLACMVIGTITTIFYKYSLHSDYSFSSLLEIIQIIVRTAPSIVFLIYIFIFHKKLKTKFMVLLLFSTYIIKYCVGICRSFFIYFSQNSTVIAIVPVTTFFLCISLPCVPFISVFNGFDKKKPFVIFMSVILSLSVISLLLSFVQVTDPIMYICTEHLLYIGDIALYIAFLIFGANNRIPAIWKSKKRVNRTDFDYEKELLGLKDSLDIGIITQEEYDARCTEIIDKL